MDAHRVRTGRLRARVPAAVVRLWTTPPPVATNRALAVIGGSFYVSGGLLALVVALAQPTLSHRSTIAVIGGSAVVVGAAVGRYAAHLRARILMNVGGTTLVLVLVLLARRGPGAEALFWLFCYVPLDSFVFFAWRLAVPMLGWGSAATAIVTFQAGVIYPVEFAAVSVVGWISAFTIGWLVRFGADALWDPVTAMPDRRGFDLALADRCADAEQTGRGFSVAALRVDGLDPQRLGPVSGLLGVQDGHGADPVIRPLAARWRALGRRDATWAHLAAGDFAVIWARSAGFDDYLDRVAAEARAAGSTVSIGMCDFHPGRDAAELWHEAVAGRIYSQRHGGDRITRSGLLSSQVAELRAAITSGQIVPFYQPLVDLESGRIVGAEALARWLHPSRGTVGPDEFIPLAEQTGDIVALGQAMLRRACADAARWPAVAGHPPRVAVNVSGRQLEDEGFVGVVGRCLAATGLPPERLTLEVTETTVGGDHPRARAILTELRGLGVRVAIDDFGTGYSNLARLAGLSVDVLKVDRSFVRQLERSRDGEALLETFINLAARLRAVSVIEGVETAEQAAVIARCGAQIGQGWLYGAPVPDAEFRRELAAQGETSPLEA